MYQNAKFLTLLLFIHLIQMFCYLVWLIIIIVSSKVQPVLFFRRMAWVLVWRSTLSMYLLEPLVLIPVKLCPFSMLLHGAILCQAFSTIARRVCGKPGRSIQITTAWPRYSKPLVVHLNNLAVSIKWNWEFPQICVLWEVSMQSLDALRMNQFWCFYW